MPIPLKKKSKISKETLLFPQNELSPVAEKGESFPFNSVAKEATGSESKRKIPFKKDPIELNQSVLFPGNIFDLFLKITIASFMMNYLNFLTRQ